MGRIAKKKKPPKLTKPAPLKEGHSVSKFDCGEDALNYWLHEHAIPAMAARTANTVVICRRRTVVGFVSIANGAVAHAQTRAKLRRNMPDPIPATIIARLAIDRTEQDNGLGSDLLFEAMKRALAATKYSAAKMLVVHPLNKRATAFYEHYGFLKVKGDTTALFLPMDTVADMI